MKLKEILTLKENCVLTEFLTLMYKNNCIPETNNKYVKSEDILYVLNLLKDNKDFSSGDILNIKIIMDELYISESNQPPNDTLTSIYNKICKRL
jgi:hypothetical protein